uniref:Uncharacterized protein n=1 Tax=Arundo donax TaxID=35708 RepID=A0A0A9EBC2_ARUDO
MIMNEVVLDQNSRISMNQLHRQVCRHPLRSVLVECLSQYPKRYQPPWQQPPTVCLLSDLPEVHLHGSRHQPLLVEHQEEPVAMAVHDPQEGIGSTYQAKS